MDRLGENFSYADNGDENAIAWQLAIHDTLGERRAAANDLGVGGFAGLNRPAELGKQKSTRSAPSVTG